MCIVLSVDFQKSPHVYLCCSSKRITGKHYWTVPLTKRGMRQVYTSIASIAAACAAVHGRPVRKPHIGPAAGRQFIVNMPLILFTNAVCGSAGFRDIRSITKLVNLQFLIREEGLAKSKCIPTTTHPPNFISNSHWTRRPQIWKGKNRNSGLNRKILMPDVLYFHMQRFKSI